MKNNSRYTLVTFDLDGTLVDTASEIVHACNQTLADFGVAPQSYDDVVSSIGHGTRELMMQQLAKVLLAKPDLTEKLRFERVYERFQHHYSESSGTTGKPYPGSLEGLVALEKAGVKCACVTNKEERFAVKVLERTSLSHFFPLLIGGDTLAYKKPDRRTLDHVMAHYSNGSRATGHVGDSSTDIVSARNSGIAAWAVSYGYNAGRPIESSQPDRIYDRIDHLASDLLQGLLD